MGCVNSWVSVEMHCAYLNQLNQKIDLQSDPEQITDMFGELLEHIIDLGHKTDIEEEIVKFKNDPTSDDVSQFEKDWEKAVLILQQSRISAQMAFINNGIRMRFDTLPDVEIEKARVQAINNYVAKQIAPQQVSIPAKASSTPDETIPEVAADEESPVGPGASHEDIPLVTQGPALLTAREVRDASTRGIVSVIQDLLGDTRLHLFEDLVNYMHAKVSQGWIDNQVIDGEVRGLKSAEHSARAIKASIHEELLNYYRSRSNGEIEVYTSGSKDDTYLFFNADNKPTGLTLVSEHEGYKIYRQDRMTKGSLRPDGSFEDVFFIIPEEGGTIHSIADNMTKTAKKVSAIPYPSEPTVTDEDYFGNGFTTIPEELNHTYFASMISSNYDVFMKNFYPPIFAGYKSKIKHRTGFVTDDTTIVAADQDSARIFMHKRTTPRLKIVLDPAGRFSGVKLDSDRPFLRATDFDMIADVLASKTFRRDTAGFAEDLLAYIKSYPKTDEAQVLASIYYRFFSPKDYEVTIDKDPLTGDTGIVKTYRSYRGLVEKNSHNEVPKADFDEWVENGAREAQAPHLNSNRLLDNALSGIITSLNSMVQHESAISQNNSVKYTNTRAFDVLPKYKSTIETYSTIETAEGVSVTRPNAIKGLTVSRLGENLLKVTVPDGRALAVKNYSAKPLEYIVKINSKKADDGMLFTIDKFSTDEQLSFSELRDVFAQFGLPSVITSTGFMTEFNSLAVRLEENENRNRPVEQFLMSTLLLMEMNSEGSVVAATMTNKENVHSTLSMRYDPVEMLFKYKPILETSLRGVYGADNRQYALDHNGNKMAIVTLKNKISDIGNLAKNVGETSINRGGLLTGSDPEVKIAGIYTKTGIKVGETVKSNQDMTIHEQAAYQIEQLLLQTASEAGFDTAAMQFGVISDKTNIPVLKFVAARDKNYFLPVNNGGSGLNTEKLHTDLIKSQNTYWTNVEQNTVENWNTELVRLGYPMVSNDIFVAAQQIRDLKIPYSVMSTGSELTKNSMLSKSADKLAVIPDHILNNIALFRSPELSNEFIKTQLELFKRGLKKEGYTKVSNKSFELLKKRFPNAEFAYTNSEESRQKATDLLFTAFFYHNNTLGGEALRLQTGGFIQFKTPSGDTIFKITNKGIDTKQVLKTAKTLQKTNLLYSSILANTNVDNDTKAKMLVFDEMASIQSMQFIDQVKRNAGMSSTGQYMRLNGKSTRGFMIGQSSKNVVIDDPNMKLKILGKSGTSGQDAYDAVQIGHPLYFIRLGNSLGNADSNFTPKGAPVKDITNAMDENGYYRFQKKATFDMFSNEMLKKGTPELYNMLVKTNTAIRFNVPSILVPSVDPRTNKVKVGDFKTPITRDMWLRNGYNLGLVYNSKTDSVVDVESLVNAINNADTIADKNAAEDNLNQLINAGSLFTDKVEQTFDNMQDLWEYFGSIDNDKAWNMVANVLGNYSGATDISLSDGTYPIRDSYVEKVGFKSQEKTGNKQILPDTAVTEDGYVFGNDTFKGWSEVDNTYHTVILQADHNPDTSSAGSAVVSEDEAENHISMITQILSAIIGEGMSVQDVVKVYNSLGVTSQLYVEQVFAEVEKLKNTISARPGNTAVGDELHRKAVAEYFIKQLRGTVSTMQTPGIIGDMIGETYKDKISFDTKQVLPLLVSTSYSTFNKNTVRMTFAGGQYIVAPSHDFLKTYRLNGVDGYTREDLNDILYDAKHPLNAIAEADKAFKLQAATIEELLPNDKVVLDIVNETQFGDLVTKMGLVPGAVTSYSTLRRLVKANYKSVPQLAEKSFNEVMTQLVNETVKFRLKGLRPAGNTLNWTKYKRYNPDGSHVEIKETEEYKAFQAIDALPPTFDEAAVEAMNKGAILVPKHLIRYFYFNQSNNKLPKEVFSEIENSIFENWLAGNTVTGQIAALDFINKAKKSDPKLIKRFEKPLYRLLQEDGWATEPAEFYMPSMHKGVFMLEDGDSVKDILGAADPDYNRVLSMGIFKPGTFSTTIGDNSVSITLYDTEDIYRQLNTNFKTINKIFGEGTEIFGEMTPEQQVAYKEFAAAKISQFNHSKEFFRQRLEDKYAKSFNSIAYEKTVDRAISKVKQLNKHVSKTSEEGKMWTAILQYLETAKASKDKDTGTGVRDDSSIIRGALNQKVPGTKFGVIDNFIYTKSRKMAAGFTTSLEFLTARIPAQGKQSGTVGKIKNFIFSSRNSCYGPLEMLTMTGADYDIDKQNMMTWQFDDDGSLIDWRPFLDKNGAISKGMFDAWAKSSGLEASEAAAYFKLATQNFIVHKLLSVFKSPKNAIESNTPVSMNKVKGAKIKPDLTKALNAKSIADILELREHASPYNPGDMFKYEKLNMDGKSGIGIFASDLKGYFATYYAFITSTDNEQAYTKFISNSGLSEQEMTKLGINPNAVQFFDMKTGDLVAESSTLANTGRYTKEGRELSKRAQEGIEAISKVDANSLLDSYMQGTMSDEDRTFVDNYMQQFAGLPMDLVTQTSKVQEAVNQLVTQRQQVIIQDYLDAINNASDMDVEEQAWEDLSELLSAATDNAKELILGQINATSDTSSIISSMVRMGIDLKHALSLVGHTDPNAKPIDVQIGTKTYPIQDIRGLIRQLRDIGDTQKEGTGFARLVPVLEKMQPEPLGLAPTEKEMKDYLANPFRQLYTFAKITEEFGIISTLLSINQGLRTTSYDVWKFKTGIEARIKDILGSKETFDLAEFIKSAADGTNYHKEKIAAFNEKRAGINVLHVLSKNAHYFGYYEAMFASKDLVGTVSVIDELTEKIIDDNASAQSKRRITDKDYKGIQNFIYGVSVEGYLTDKTFTIDGKVFDLSVASNPMQSDSDIGGRYEFIQYLPNAIQQATQLGIENSFLDSIPVQDSVVDYVTQVKLPILKGPNLMNISPERYAEMKMGLTSLKKTHKELYDALFLYSLITTKGAYAGGSFMALYGTDKYIAFSEYVRDNTKYIADVAASKRNEILIKLNNPVFVETFSTDSDISKAYLEKKKKRHGDEEGEDEAWSSEDTYGAEPDFVEYDNSEGIADNLDDGSFRRRKTFADIEEKHFDVSNITTAKIMGNITENLIRSKETGIIYKWDEDIKVWIPLVQRIPNVVIPFSSINVTGIITDTGFSEGWDVTLPVAGTNGVQKTSRVIAYMDSALIARLRKGENDSEFANAIGVQYNTPLDKNTNYYLVKHESGAYSIESADELMANSNNNLILSRAKIVRKYTSDRENVTVTKRQHYYQKDGVMYDREIPGSTAMSGISINSGRIANAESLIGKFYPFDAKSMSTIADSIEDTFTMNLEQLDNSYSRVMDLYYNNLLVDFDEDVDAARRELESTFSMYDTPIAKLNTLYRAERMFKTRFKDVDGVDMIIPISANILNGIKPPSIARRVLTDRALLENTSWAQIQELFKNIGVSGDKFRSLVKTSLMGKNGKIDVYKGITDHMISEDGVSTPFRKLIVSNKIKEATKYSIEHTVPDDMRNDFNKAASPSVLAKLLNVLQERFPDSSFTMMGTAQIETEFGKEFSRPGVKAFVKNGTIIFNQERITLDTPVHEFSHIYMQYLKVDNKDLYKKLVTEALTHPLASHMAKSYPGLSNYELGEEVVVSLIAAKVNGLTTDNGFVDSLVDETSKGSKVFDKILQFFKELFAKAFNTSPSKMKFRLTDSLGDIINQLGNDIAYGKGSMLEDFSPKLRDTIRKSRRGETLNFREVLDILKDRGFVERVCV